MNKLLLFLLTLSFSTTVMAQDFPYGQVSQQELDMKKYDRDTSAHALILNEHGSSRITVNGLDDIKLLYQYHVKVKFFDDKEFNNQGTVEITIYNGDNNVYEDVTEIKGTTFYKDDKGQTQQIELDPKNVKRVKEDKHYTTLKFAMPGLRNGCVIDVTYKLESPYFFHNFKSWRFQDDIPKLHSEYEVHIPGFWSYKASLRGALKLTKNKAELERNCFAYHGANADCSDIVYGMDNVPAFINEDYMTSAKNFVSGVYFELEQYMDLSTGAKTYVSKEWKNVDYELKTAFWFGGQLKKKEMLKDRIAPAIAGKTDTLEKAKAVYSFIQKTFKWNERSDFGSVDGIRKALDAHTGDAGDINMALITALNAAGIRSEAVLLSTRSHGTVNKLYPGIGDFNYVIAKTNIGGKSYLLDATDPLLPFGMLPMRCLNDKGRVFSLDKPSYWIDMVTPQRETETYSFDLTLQDNGKLKGTLTHYSLGYSGYLKRREIKKFNSVDEYVENLDEKLPKLKILKSSIKNLDTLDMPLAETYEVEFDGYDNLNHDRLSFNPFMMDHVTTNPFKLAERDYPVDWGMPSDERYILTIHLPAQYTIENPPQGQSMSMPNNGGGFTTNFEGDNNTFTFSHITRFNKSIYEPEEYPYLKELYNKIILSQKSEMVFKKKS
ncbi:MAG TPA: transglutaminase domain-containing protein [Mucilaginibacter sp.]|nr:transglutaminase domain-containing protein [Mucilaginibacter sp.]